MEAGTISKNGRSSKRQMSRGVFLILIVSLMMMTACKKEVTGVSLDKTELTLVVGETESLHATILPANADNNARTWSSSNPAVATVTMNSTTIGFSSGFKDKKFTTEIIVVTAVSPGTAIITVTTEDGGYTAACTVTVTAK